MIYMVYFLLRILVEMGGGVVGSGYDVRMYLSGCSFVYELYTEYWDRLYFLLI